MQDMNTKLLIAEEAGLFETAHGIKPTKLYIGLQQKIDLLNECGVLIFDKKCMEPEYRGMELFIVDRVNYVGVGV